MAEEVSLTKTIRRMCSIGFHLHAAGPHLCKNLRTIPHNTDGKSEKMEHWALRVVHDIQQTRDLMTTQVSVTWLHAHAKKWVAGLSAMDFLHDVRCQSLE